MPASMLCNMEALQARSPHRDLHDPANLALPIATRALQMPSDAQCAENSAQQSRHDSGSKPILNFKADNVAYSLYP